MISGQLRAQIFPLVEQVVGHWSYTDRNGTEHFDEFIAYVPEGNELDYDPNLYGQQRSTVARDGITTQCLCIFGQLQAAGARNIKFSLIGGRLWD